MKLPTDHPCRRSGKRRGGRPTKRRPDIVEQFLKLVRAGNYQRDAARGCGLGESTVMEWKRENPEFADACKKAEAEAIAWHVANIQKAAKHSWQASAWYLERKCPYHWGKRDASLPGSEQESELPVVRRTIIWQSRRREVPATEAPVAVSVEPTSAA
jgi:hypothetical protein